MDIKLTEALDALESKLKGANTLETKTLLEGFKESFDAELKNKVEALETKSKQELEAAQLEVKNMQELQEVQQKHLDSLDLKLKNNVQTKDANLSSLITKNIKAISTVTKSVPFNMEVKDMTLANALTGDQPRDYNFDVVKRPAQMVNVEDLASTIPISGGTYTYVRSTLVSGTVGEPIEGATKNQLAYDYAMIDANTNYIAGFSVYSKKMRNNLPFLENTLGIDLRRDYMRGENATFNAILEAEATASTKVITDSNKIEMLIAELAELAANDFMADCIVVTPTDWYDIMITEKSSGAGYGLPGIVTFDNGVLRVNGVAVKMATWLSLNKYFVGDWSRVRKPVTEGFTFAVSEDDSDNFRKNNLTARVEAQVTLTVEQPDALIFGDFTAA